MELAAQLAIDWSDVPAEKSSSYPRVGEIVHAYVMRVTRDAAYVDICCEHEIAMPKWSDTVKVGDVVQVRVAALDDECGCVLSKFD